MKFANLLIAFVSCVVVAITIYNPFLGLEFGNGIFSFINDSPGNRSGDVRVSDQSVVDKPMRISISEEIGSYYSPLEHDYYRYSCPYAERIIGKAVRDLYDANPSIAPSLIQLLFHDCFIEGCDASILLGADESQTSEKEALPNLSLKGFDVVNAIKMDLEIVCPGIVSCADILALAAREAVREVGGPRYSLRTGRKDSVVTFRDIAEQQLPSPQDSLSVTLARFASRGFSPRETVTLFGAHSIGITHCTVFEDRLYNFSGTGKPDPQLNREFLRELKTKCPFSASVSSPSPSTGTGLAPSLPASGYSKN